MFAATPAIASTFKIKKNREQRRKEQCLYQKKKTFPKILIDIFSNLINQSYVTWPVLNTKEAGETRHI